MIATILLVEDNPITVKLVRFTLERERYKVVDAGDGPAALAQFAEHRPELVLLDLVLPNTDGFELLPQLRALPGGADVPILAFSGMLSAYEDGRLAKVGFDDVVSKPVEPSRLLQIVRGHLPSGETERAGAVPGAEQRSVLLADDDAVQRKMVALRLQRAGFSVTATADGQEALEVARALRPYAIVSDVLMPRLDGFGLCMAVRNDPQLANTPVVLISNSYLDAEDKALAHRAGADRLLLRTADLSDVIQLLRSDLHATRVRAPVEPDRDPAIERERIQRMMKQLERQLAMHAGLAQRCTLLSTELTVLSTISEAVATEDDLEGALYKMLAACFDAGSVELGLLYLVQGRGLRSMRFGASQTWTADDIETFFGHRDVLDRAIATPAMTALSATDASAALLARATARSLVIAPLHYKGQALGALVMMSRAVEQATSDRIDFAQAIAGQISLALTLARSFQAKDASERAARANATVLRSILDSMAEGVIVCDDHGAITHLNQAALSNLTVPASDLSGSTLDVLEFPIVRALRGELVDRSDVRVQARPEDPVKWLSISGRRMRDEAAGIDGVVAVFRDVTIERAASARLLVTERMAALGTVAAGVGHEINNPLMAVIGNVQMALHDARALDGAGAEIAEVLQDALDAAERVRNIVRDLKLFSRGDQDTVQPVSIEQVIESALRMYASEIRTRARVVRELRAVPMVTANEGRLGQVFLNLIVNATQALPDDRAGDNVIRVTTSLMPDGRVRAEIADNGCGMPPEVVAQIFTPFFTTKPIGVGTGLGLSICHQLVSSVGGEILVHSMPGVGTTFAILLPAAEGARG